MYDGLALGDLALLGGNEPKGFAFFLISDLDFYFY